MQNYPKPKHQTVKATLNFNKQYPKLPDQIICNPYQSISDYNDQLNENKYEKQIRKQPCQIAIVLKNKQKQTIDLCDNTINILQNRFSTKNLKQLKIPKQKSTQFVKQNSINNKPSKINLLKQPTLCINLPKTNTNTAIIANPQLQNIVKMQKLCGNRRQYQKFNTSLQNSQLMRSEILKYSENQYRAWAFSMSEEDIKDLYKQIAENRKFIQGRQLKYKLLEQQRKQKQKAIQKQLQLQHQLKRKQIEEQIRKLREQEKQREKQKLKQKEKQRERERQRQKQRLKQKEKEKQKQKTKKSIIQNQLIINDKQNKKNRKKQTNQNKKQKNKSSPQSINLISSQSSQNNSLIQQSDSFFIRIQQFKPKNNIIPSKLQFNPTICIPKQRVVRVQQPVILSYNVYQESSFNSISNSNSNSSIQNKQNNKSIQANVLKQAQKQISQFIQKQKKQKEKQNALKCLKIIEQTYKLSQINPVKRSRPPKYQKIGFKNLNLNNEQKLGMTGSNCKNINRQQIFSNVSQ